MTARKWTDEDKAKAAALVALCGNVKKAAQEAGIPRTTVMTWLNEEDPGFIRFMEQAREQFDKTLPGMFADIMQKAAEQVLAKLPNASAAQAATIMGIATDKRALVAGKPTTISGKAENVEDRLRKTKAWLESMSGRSDGTEMAPVASRSSSRKKRSLLQ